MHLYHLFLTVIYLILELSCSIAEDVVGCGGFVRSSVQINYSRVEIKLFTKQGSLKYQAEGAPNNGYYFIPLYDKGDYVLKVEPPSGWVFEPSAVDLHVDGKSDPCYLGQDINFIFKGFSLYGKVVSKGHSGGPADVQIALKTSNGEVLKEVKTAAGGNYVFNGILPGDYVLSASHPVWSIENSKLSLKVTNDNAHIHQTFAVTGFDVQGEVLSDGEPIRGVHFILVVQKPTKVVLPEGCITDHVRGFRLPSGLQYLCHVTSSDSGKFIFPSVSPGNYRLIPFYKGEHIEFDVSPSQVDFTVEQQSLKFKEKFQVQGFSVSGSVKTSPGGRGIEGAEVLLNGAKVATSGPNGVFHLENMKTGQYTLHIKVPHMLFDPVPVKITPNTPELAVITASQFDICGSLIIQQPSKDIPLKAKRELLVSDDKKSVTTLQTDVTGAFCTMVKPGAYVIKPLVSNKEEGAGLKFSPSELRIQIADEPVYDIRFTQFQATVQGRLKCIEQCGTLKLLLQSLDRNEVSFHSSAQENGQFSFTGLIPGNYRLTVMKEDWCWDKKSLDIVIKDKDIMNVLVVQTGFLMSVTTSHSTSLKMISPVGKEEALNVNSGPSVHCLPHKGVYTFVNTGCHLFKEENLKFDTSHSSSLMLTAVKHSFSGSVVTEENVTDLVISATVQGAGHNFTEKISLKENVAKDKAFIYSFSIMLPPQAHVEIMPMSRRLLFSPIVYKVTMGGDCMKDAVQFKGRLGLFVNGQITPPLEHVKITVKDRNNNQPDVFLKSDSKGSFVVGPLDSESKYDIEAEREGYIFKPLNKLGHFEAFKLAEIHVEVLGEANDPLSGVLLSLSGGVDYRKNSMTQQDGKLQFPGLSPGQYFLRPVMKEYQFEPNSKIIEVKEGATITVKVKGKRVAFTCHGVISSVTGEAEPGISIEAVGVKGTTCELHQEEGVSEQDGSFKIRGLQPNCEYVIRLKKGVDVNQHIERAAPKERVIQVATGDIGGIRVIVFRYFNQLDITGNVVTATQFLPSLRVRLLREDSQDQTVLVQSLGHSGFFQLPPLPMDSRPYVLCLESNLPSNTYHVKSPSVSFRANATYRHFTFYFDPRPVVGEQEMTQGSLLALPLTLVVIILCYHYPKVLNLLNQGTEIVQGIFNPGRAAGMLEGGISDVVGRKKVKPRRVQ